MKQTNRVWHWNSKKSWNRPIESGTGTPRNLDLWCYLLCVGCMEKTKNKNTTKSGQFQNQTSKIVEKAKLIPLSHKLGQICSLSGIGTGKSIKNGGAKSSLCVKPPLVVRSCKYFPCHFQQYFSYIVVVSFIVGGSHWQTLSQHIVLNTPRHERDSNSQRLWW